MQCGKSGVSEDLLIVETWYLFVIVIAMIVVNRMFYVNKLSKNLDSK